PPVEAWARALAQLGYLVAPAALAEAHTRTMQEMAGALQPPPEGQPEDLSSHVAVWSEVYRRTLRQAGVAGDLERAVAAMWEVWLGGTWEVYAEVPHVLGTLAERGHRLGIISNWTPTLEETCRRLGLARYCTVIVSSASAGYAKPHPRIFELALVHAGVCPEGAIHVGDRYDTDVIGARAVGMDAVLLNRSPAPGHRVHGALAVPVGEGPMVSPASRAPTVPTIHSLTDLLHFLSCTS
ncbi:MAG: hypothetical protein C4289_06095, partial [Chloroflexota bacterium]